MTDSHPEGVALHETLEEKVKRIVVVPSMVIAMALLLLILGAVGAILASIAVLSG